MKRLSDSIVTRLRAEMQIPDLTDTRYGMVRYLACGGMGSVWLVQDSLLKRQVALKVLDIAASTSDLAARLLQEAWVLASLEHPGIVPVHDAGTLEDGRAFYCMKYVEGQTLAQHISNKTIPEKLRLLERIAEPLDFAHARGFIHRDLKPENIMVGAFGEVLVMDWGLAKIIRSPQCEPEAIALPPMSSAGTGEGGVLGTPGFMSPEQQRGDNEIDHRTDIFSLGALLWFALTGPPANLSQSAADIPRALRAICAKAMADDPAARYQSAREMSADIANYLNAIPLTAYKEGWLERAGRVYARHRIAIVLVAAYLLMRGFFILWTRH